LFEGPNGWAEWAPFVEYTDEEAAVWLAAAIDFAYGELPPLHRDRIAVNATLPAVAPDLVERVLTNFGEFATVKIKVAEAGHSLSDDIARIEKVRELYPEAKIRLDANGGLEISNAIELVNQLQALGINIEYFEQPVASIAEMAELRLQLSRLGVKIAADESVRKVSDPLAVAQANAADVLVLKAAPLGGIGRALAIAAEAELPVVISSALDTSVGLSMGAYLAAAIPNLEFDCGLATSALLAGDVTREPLRAENGFIDVRRVEVDESKLEIFKAQDHREDWWLERLERVYKLL
jgi:O-succinylbenzoate synthase